MLIYTTMRALFSFPHASSDRLVQSLALFAVFYILCHGWEGVCLRLESVVWARRTAAPWRSTLSFFFLTSFAPTHESSTEALQVHPFFIWRLTTQPAAEAGTWTSTWKCVGGRREMESVVWFEDEMQKGREWERERSWALSVCVCVCACKREPGKESERGERMREKK